MMIPTTSKAQRKPNLVKKPEGLRESRRICLPIDPEVYQQMVNDQEAYRAYLDNCIRRYPELFPASIAWGYKFNGFCEESVKMPEVGIRRICLHESDEHGGVQVFQVVPSFILPYLTGEVVSSVKTIVALRFYIIRQ